jgi:hypothetical protein
MTQRRSLFLNGFSTMLRHWPALVWAYAFNLGLAWLFSLPLHNQIAAITEHSFASQTLGQGFDLGALAGVAGRLNQGPGPSGSATYLSLPIYLLIYFLLVPGTLFCYQTGAPARLSTLLQTGILYFWRFVRITLISLVVFAVVLGPLMALYRVWDKHVDAHITGRSETLHDIAGLIVIGLVAAALRVYFDLVEVYTVALGQTLRVFGASGELVPDRRVRYTFGPAWRAFSRNFFRMYITFVLLFLAGLSAVILTARVAMHTLAQPRVWPAFCFVQVGLFLMMLTRFWQRGAETTLAQDCPLPLRTVVVVEPVLPEPMAQEFETEPDIAVAPIDPIPLDE